MAKKMTVKQDDAYDKKNKIKPGSKKDKATDKKNGVYAMEYGKKGGKKNGTTKQKC